MSRNILSLIPSKGEYEHGEDFFALKKSTKKRGQLSLKEIEDTLKSWRVEYKVKNSNHIKIGVVNYYPSTGTCYIDGMGASFKNRGLNFLKELLRKERIL